MPIYIDLTSFIAVEFMTGIQRVVWEVVIRLLKIHNNIIIISYDNEVGEFKKVVNSKFIEYYVNNKGSKKEIITNELVYIKDIQAGAIFFDIDSTWNNKLKRSYLLPILKEQGVKIIVHIYDIIPILYPQYCHQDTIFRFLDYLGAYIQYADCIITNTNSTHEDLQKVASQIGIECPLTKVVPLGSDFKKNNGKTNNIDPKIMDIVGKGKYILQVGTLEPRKNHELVIDAFDEKIKDLDINLIFVGRIGWNVKNLARKIENHPQLGERFFHLEGCNDETVNYLYENAFLTVFPTYYEGFGLPIIESIERGVPVISSDCKVLREVGKEYCDYFSIENTHGLIKLVQEYNNNPDKYIAKKEQIKKFKSIKWDQAAQLMADILGEMSGDKKYEIKSPKQMVMLSAQPDMILETLPYIESLMEFIKEVVILCPSKIKNLVQEKYAGRLEINFLFDEDILQGVELPKDHATRNFLLRCLAMKNNIIDDVFVMSDDDYRPIIPIKEEVFLQYGKYKAYYCYELSQWKGSIGELTSYDISMFKAYEYLKSKGLPTKQYSAHMPQIIDKRLYLEMINEYPNIEYDSVDEWTTYFNYAIYKYPHLFEVHTYKTLCWPALPTDWDIMIYPKEYLFENYYPNLYQKNNLFAGFSTEYKDNIILENIQKIKLRDSLQQKYMENRQAMLAIEKVYEYKNEKPFEISIDYKENAVQINLPQYFVVPAECCAKIKVKLLSKNFIRKEYLDSEIGYIFKTQEGILLQKGDVLKIFNQRIDDQLIVEIPIWTPNKIGECILTIYFIHQDKQIEIEQSIPVFVYNSNFLD